MEKEVPPEKLGRSGYPSLRIRSVAGFAYVNGLVYPRQDAPLRFRSDLTA
jgi:hypothetical protein